MNQKEKLKLLYKQIEKKKEKADPNKIYKKNMEIFNKET